LLVGVVVRRRWGQPRNRAEVVAGIQVALVGGRRPAKAERNPLVVRQAVGEMPGRNYRVEMERDR
jgi:hypothetical protein